MVTERIDVEMNKNVRGKKKERWGGTLTIVPS